jgi:hypothetical protein
MALRVDAYLGLNGSGFQQGLQTAGGAMRSFAERAAALFSIGAATRFFTSVINFASEIKDLAARMGVSTERVQEFSFAARQSGADISQVAFAITKLKKAMAEVISGSGAGKKLAEGFERMGISIQQVKTLRADEIFEMIANKASKANLSVIETADLLGELGKGGDKLIPTLNELGAKMQEFRDSGMGIKDDDVRTLEAAGDSLEKMLFFGKLIGARALIATKFLVGGGLGKAVFGDPAEDAAMHARIWDNVFGKEIREKIETARGIRDSLKWREVPQKDFSEDELKGMSKEAGRTREAAIKLEQQNRFEALSAEEKLAQLSKERQENEKSIAYLKKINESDPSNALNIAQFMLRNAEIDSSIAGSGLRKRKADGGGAPDSLVNVGNFLGSRQGGIVGISQKQYDVQNRIFNLLQAKLTTKKEDNYP